MARRPTATDKWISSYGRVQLAAAYLMGRRLPGRQLNSSLGHRNGENGEMGDAGMT
jgi:hypothetical protein